MNLKNDITDSFKNTEGGFSARKLTAFTFVCFAAFIHATQLTHENAVNFLLIDVTITLLCLSIVTFEQILKFKNGTKTTENEEPNNQS